jgi:hypothetical protein
VIEEIKNKEGYEVVNYWKTVEAVIDIFTENRDFIERSCGITLSNIEALGLRKITEQVLKEAIEARSSELASGLESLSLVDPQKEIPARFFYEFYNLSPQNLEDLYTNDGDKFKEFFRRRQETLHHDKEID